MFEDINMMRWLLACLTMAGLLGIFAIAAAKYKQNQGFGFSFKRDAKKKEKSLRVEETLWLDGRHKVVKIADGHHLHTVLMTPQNSLLLQSTTKETSKAEK